MSLVDSVLEAFKAEHLTRTAAPGLYSSMDEVAAKLNIPMPKFYVLPEKYYGHPLFDGLANAPNAASLSKTDIIISKPILRLLKSSDLSKPLSEEMKAILAHEMHHCANRGSMMAMSRVPVAALPVIAIAATYMYDKAHAKAQKEGDTSAANVVKHMGDAAKETQDSLPSETGRSTFFKNVITTGKYIAVATAGLGVGLLVARYGARYHEFAADLFASKNVSNKEVMISALKKIHQAAGLSISEHPEAEKFKGILAETIMAHPSMAERAAHIRSH